MSTRARSVPWFLERPEFYRYALELGPGGRGYVEVQAWWSWNMQTWFDRSGNVVRGGQREHVLDQLDAQVPFADVRMFDGVDPFIGWVS